MREIILEQCPWCKEMGVLTRMPAPDPAVCGLCFLRAAIFNERPAS